jgi:hypothetical protein
VAHIGHPWVEPWDYCTSLASVLLQQLQELQKLLASNSNLICCFLGSWSPRYQDLGILLQYSPDDAAVQVAEQLLNTRVSEEAMKTWFDKYLPDLLASVNKPGLWQGRFRCAEEWDETSEECHHFLAPVVE